MGDISSVSKPLHRKAQLESIESSIKSGQHLFITGSSGSGKTLCVKYAVSQKNHKFAYVDCCVYKTRAAIVTKILIDLGFPVARQGVSFDYLYEKLDRFLNDNKVLVVLDDLHRLPKNEMVIINNLVDKAMVIAVSFKSNILDKLDRKVYDVFLPVRLSFPSYSKEELTDILEQKFGEAGGLEHIAKYACTHNGNCRLAVECSKRIKQRWNKIDLNSTLTWLNEIKGI